jgi:hypothetical protein
MHAHEEHGHPDEELEDVVKREVSQVRVFWGEMVADEFEDSPTDVTVLACEMQTPFGLPVLPLVSMMQVRASGIGLRSYKVRVYWGFLSTCSFIDGQGESLARGALVTTRDRDVRFGRHWTIQSS